MPKYHIHLKQACLNERIAEIAARHKHNDWAITMYFYAAIHYVETYAIHHGDNIYEMYSTIKLQHRRRLFYVRDISYDNTGDYIYYFEYKKLFDASRQARYLEKLKTTARKHFSNDLERYSNALSVVKNLFTIPTV